jgi:predicted transcriptional regulator
MDDVLVSIRSNLVDLIVSGEKTVELRTTNLKLRAKQTVWIYSKAPKAAVEIVAEVREVYRLAPSTIWRRFGQVTGLSKTEFDKFSEGRSQLTAIEFSEVQKLESPFSLENLRSIKSNFHPPQLVHYLSDVDPVCFALRKSRTAA